MQTKAMYSTGEIAKLCNISVRTVQYYDSRELVIPTGISEGGRRLYSNEDLAKMKIVCFLRDLNIPINTVAKILKEANSKKVISLLLKEQKSILESEIKDKEVETENNTEKTEIKTEPTTPPVSDTTTEPTTTIQ